ncbi:MAG: amidohydrolase family protein [Marinagarivorans sp.]|nr:amidohydrolase family protein [Marinagarivorans sp.]
MSAPPLIKSRESTATNTLFQPSAVPNTVAQNNECLIQGAFIYTANPQQPFIQNGWLWLRDSQIAGMGECGIHPEPAVKTIINGRGRLLVPGFVNPHWHESFAAPNDERADDSHVAPTAYARGGDIAALGALFGFISGVGKRMTLGEAQAIARWSLWTQLRSGTTAIGDMGSANTADGLALAAIDLGMRIRVSRWGSDIMIPYGASDFKRIANTQEQADDWLALLERWHNHRSGLVGGMPSVMGAFGSSNEQLAALADVVSRFDTPYATHLAPLKNERDAVQRVFGRSPIERFDDHGLLTPRLLAVHTAYASEPEYQRLLATGVHLCHAPAHYGMLGEATLSETKQLARFMRDGASVSTSTDGDITFIGGMPEALRATHLCHNEANNCTTTCPPTAALITGTFNGAKALGWGDKIGTLAVGKQADVVLINIDDYRYRLGNHPLRTFLVAGSSKDVDTVIVAGQIVVQNGKSTRFEEGELFKDFEAAVASIRRRIHSP